MLEIPSQTRIVFVWDFSLPGDVENAPEKAQVEDVQLSLLSGAKGPGLTAVQKCAHDASSVDLDLGMYHKFLIVPNYLCQSRNVASCLADALV